MSSPRTTQHQLPLPIAKKQSKSQKSRDPGGPRIRLKQERLYETICGHPPDTRRVAPLEFELLAHIAATRSDGLLQGELVRLSGQDKRSVPKRTDALHQKGYIVKVPVFHRGNRTSHLKLKKSAAFITTDGGPVQQRGSTIRDVIRRTFDILANKDLVPQTGLGQALNLQTPAQSMILQKVVRRLEKLKWVKRVRTAVGPSATSSDLQYFVQLVRLPDHEDLREFDNEKLALDQTVEDMITIDDTGAARPLDTSAIGESGDSLIPLHKSSKWNPDRSISNIMLEAVKSAGAKGLTLAVCAHLTVSLHYR